MNDSEWYGTYTKYPRSKIYYMDNNLKIVTFLVAITDKRSTDVRY